MKCASLCFIVAALVPVVPAVAGAAPPCASGTLASYIALGSSGCSIGSVTFVHFSYSARETGGAVKITPSQIKVTPSFAIPATAALTFSAPWRVTSSQAQDSIIKYLVISSVSSKSDMLMLQLGSDQVGSFSSVQVREKTTAGNLVVFRMCSEVACQTKNPTTLTFTPAATGLQLSDHVHLSANATGDASLSGYTATFDYCPPCT
jgi:hypothetical protein